MTTETRSATHPTGGPAGAGGGQEVLAPPAGRRGRLRTGSVVLDIVLVAFGLLMVAPLVWLVSTSLTDPGDAFQVPPNWLPVNPTLQNFAGVADLVPFGQMAVNSVVVSVIATLGSLVVSSLAAYGFSRFAFRGRDAAFLVMLSALMVPAQLLIIPVFMLMRWLGLVDTLAALWLPALIQVFSIFFLRQYFNSVPRELDDAAKLDGAGHLWILFRMVLPLSGPAVSAVAILVFEATWNSYFAPLIFISTPENMTLPLGLVALQSAQGGVEPTGVFAAITAVVIPALVVFLLFQRHFVASIATAGIRG